MEATPSQPPSPQSVGREFVRQYYTLLNKAPNHLHRFYNNQSSFVHDESTLVVGQKNIHGRIQQLNFHDCHAKISQMDAQATLGNGVVIQVSGELSNNGQPMRRFTQTFVLAAQSPRKYYVHNDIFRYQDVYLAEESDIESRIESTEDHEDSAMESRKIATEIAEQQLLQVDVEQQQASIQREDVYVGTANTIEQQNSQAVYYSVHPGGGRPITVPTVHGPAPLQTNFANLTLSVPLQKYDSVQLNDAATHDELMTRGMIQRTSIQLQSSLIYPTQSSAASQGITASVESEAVDCAENSVDTISNNASQVFSQTSTATIKNYQQQQQQQQQQQRLSSGMQTYANLFKSFPSSNNFVSTTHQTQNHCDKKSLQATSNISSITFTQSSNMNSSASTIIYGAHHNNNINGTTNNTNSTNENNQCDPTEAAQRFSSKNLNRDFEHRRSNNFQFDDNQQLFVGNIPHHTSEEDLKALFSRFGSVLDLKVLSKASGKLPTGIKSPLNYGFITYKDAESVQNCLAHCPLYFPENSPSRQKLNVEKKKPRSRPNDMPTRQSVSACASIGGGGINNNINNNQRNTNNNGPLLARGGNGADNNMIQESRINNNSSRGGSSVPRVGNTFCTNDNRNTNNGNLCVNNNIQANNKNYDVRR